VSALYEQGRVRHIGKLTELEDQMCEMTGAGFAGSGSPDRVDAAVHALTDLMCQPHRPTAQYGVWGSPTPLKPAKSKFDGPTTITYAHGNISTGYASSRR
jgi:hypothetical protein